MIIHLRLLIPILMPWVLFLRVDALRNVTLDDQDSAIVYTPARAWKVPGNSSLDYQGAHMLTQHPAATATFSFTGVAIYFLSPRWPYNVSTAVSLDCGPSFLIDLVDHSRPDAGGGPETVKSQVVWNATGLENKRHTLVISVGQGQSYAIVDGLIYTKVNPTLSSTTPLSSSASLSPPPLSSSTSSSSSNSSLSSVSSSSSASLPSSTSSLFSVSSSSSTFLPSSTSSLFSAPPPSTSTPAVITGTSIPSTDNTGAASKKNLSIALGSVAGVLALLLIFGIVCFRHLSRRRRPMTISWTIDGSSDDGNSVISNGNRNGTRYSHSQWVPRDRYPVVQPYGYSMNHLADGTWQNSQYGFVANIIPPGMSPPNPAQQVYYPHPQNHYDQSYTHGNTSNIYVPRYTLSSMLRSSPPSMVGPHSPLLANSSSTSVNMLNAEDLPGYHTALGPKYPGGRQPLVVVSNSGSESGTQPYDGMQAETPDSQLSPMDERSSSYQKRSSRRLL